MSFFGRVYSLERIRSVVCEIVGTFMLVFAGTGAIVINDVTDGRVSHVGIALTFGLVVMALIYSLGDISGAHLNPAVTFGFWFAKRFPTKDVAPYVVSQCIGAIAASFVLSLLFVHPTLGATVPNGSLTQSFVLEGILTAFLMFVILNVACGAKETGPMAGVAIGAVITLEALFAGPICGASMNPARSLAPALVSGRLTELWVYLLAPLLGSAVGVALFQILRAPVAVTPIPSPSTSEAR
jgi:MIP family channel proteins